MPRATPLMPQWRTDGDGVPVGALSDETVLVAVMTVVGRSDSVALAVAIGVSVVTMTSVGELVAEVSVAVSMGVSEGSMTSDVMVEVVEVTPGTTTVVSVGRIVSVGRTMMDVTPVTPVGSTADEGSSAVVEAGTDVTFADEEIGIGRTLTSTVEVTLAKEVKFPGMLTEVG